MSNFGVYSLCTESLPCFLIIAQCTFVLHRKRCNELVFECSRSGRYRGENATCGSWTKATAQNRKGQTQEPRSRCTARMVVIKSGSGRTEAVQANGKYHKYYWS